MKEAVVKALEDSTRVVVHDVAIPAPGRDDVLIRVIAFGTNPKDWKQPLNGQREYNSGDDVAGIVEDVGQDVFEFKKGDRVAGFHVMGAPAGGFAEYAIVPSHTVMHIPQGTTFEEAATIPLAALTAAFALFRELSLPMPWLTPARQVSRTPLIVYGASTAVGAFVIKLAHWARIHPIIAVGSETSDFIREYLDASEGDALIDYKAYEGQEPLVKALKDAVTATGCTGPVYAADAPGSASEVIAKAVSSFKGTGSGGRPRLTEFLPKKDFSAVAGTLDVSITYVGKAHRQGEDSGPADELFAATWMTLFSRGLKQGWLKPHPHEVIPGGLNGLEDALVALRAGKVRAKKMVGRVAETAGLS